ncbi:MAG: 16S rRNA (cytidine(1402)-2'-O)-methyltransferase [Gammaproteobacteria bacterium]|jgi:16S rRNA (cytidine1402-2'-O)-methyltransferase
MSTSQPYPPGSLLVVGTPIGNAADLSPRAAEVLSLVDVIAAEDTRRTRGLLTRIGLNKRLIAYHDHNEDKAAAQLLERLTAGERVALVADAGMPTISDPGMRLVALARARGLPVLSVPGPCAATAALSVSGLPSDRYCFEGFLPRREGQRRSRVQALAAEQRTVIFYESVHRLEATLATLAEVFGPARRAVIARELTKLHESCYGGTLAELGTRIGKDIELRGEFVVVVEGAPASAGDDAEVARVYGLLAEALEPGLAVALTAKVTGRPRNAVYRLARGT